MYLYFLNRKLCKNYASDRKKSLKFLQYDCFRCNKCLITTFDPSCTNSHSNDILANSLTSRIDDKNCYQSTDGYNIIMNNSKCVVIAEKRMFQANAYDQIKNQNRNRTMVLYTQLNTISNVNNEDKLIAMCS